MSIQTLMGSVIPLTNKSERRTIPILKLAFFVLVFIAVFGSLWSGLQEDPGVKNLYVQQAQAFLQGRLDLNQYFYDTAVYKGRYYVPFPPFPAILLVPFVAVLGPAATKGVLISLGLTILNVVIFIQTLKKLKLEAELIPWITAAFFLGTSYWMSVMASRGVWFLAHVVAVTCLLLAIHEAVGTGRGFLIGLFLGMAILSRQVTVYMIIFLVTALWINPRFTTFKEKLTNLVWFAVPLLLLLTGYLGFNWLRFDHPLDPGYAYIFDVPHGPDFLQARVQKYGLFHPAYIPFNFVNMFLQGFHIEFKPPFYISGMEMDGFGTSLTFASPFVFIAFWAKWKRPLLWAAWLSVSLALIHILMYHGNGYWQANGQRYTLDFLPVVMLLVALGLKRVPTHIWKGAIIYSILLNVLALFIIPLMAELMSMVVRLV